MYEGIKQTGRFLRGLVSSSYRLECYYQKRGEWFKRLHEKEKGFEGLEIKLGTYHLFHDVDCDLVSWILNFGRI